MRHNDIAGNQATGTLKLIALVAMMTDHIGATIFTRMPWLRVIGRLAFPLYCWCMVVGFTYTRSRGKYLLRLLCTAVITQPLCVLTLRRGWLQPNIFITLALALCALWGIREKRYLSHLWAPVLAAWISQAIRSEYGWKGVALVVLLYLLRGNRAALAVGMAIFCATWSQSTAYTLPGLLGYPISWKTQPTLAYIVSWVFSIQAMAILSLPLICIRFRKNIRLPGVLSYALYPAHLLVLYGLQKLL